MISSLDVAHLLQTGELAMHLGPGKGGGLGCRVHIWDDVTLGRLGYALCRWRDREARLLSDMGLCVKRYQMLECNVQPSFHLQARFFFFFHWAGSGPQDGKAVKKELRWTGSAGANRKQVGVEGQMCCPTGRALSRERANQKVNRKSTTGKTGCIWKLF